MHSRLGIWFPCDSTGLIPGLVQWAKDLALAQLQGSLQLQLRFSPWPGNFHMLRMWPKTEIILKKNVGVPVVAQRKQTQLVSLRMWVQNVALLSGLTISGIA